MRNHWCFFMDRSEKSKFNELVSQSSVAEIFPVVKRIPADLITPFGAYLKLSREAKYSFLFESVEGGENLGRYSFLGANPEFVVIGDNGRTHVTHSNKTYETDESIYEALKRLLRKRKVASLDNLPSFLGGAVGYLNFSMIEFFEPILKTSLHNKGDNMQSKFGFYKTIVAFDHAKQEISVITNVFVDDLKDKERPAEDIRQAQIKNQKIIEKLQRDDLPSIPSPNKTDSSVSSNWEKNDFKKAVSKIKELIKSGECYQVVLSQCLKKPTNASPEIIYRALRALNPSPYMILMKHGKSSIVGASPEMLLRCRDRKLEYRPIAGTRPRGKNDLEDSKLAIEMKADAKEVSEHTMLVDLGRNDLGRVAKFGSVKVRNLMTVEKFSHVQHLVTYLQADLCSDFDQFDALASCFPAGTVTGAPKIRAIQIIKELEPSQRGIYSGAVGYLDYAGNLDTCIAIRTIVLENGIAKIQAGAGIVADSDPETEYQETLHKANGLLKAIELAESGEYSLLCDDKK